MSAAQARGGAGKRLAVDRVIECEPPAGADQLFDAC
jgi:hypothetical protein